MRGNEVQRRNLNEVELFPTITDENEKEHKDCDPGTKSEGEEDSITVAVKKSLGRTPNHLTLSTTSTLSAGSTGSQAKLIQSSQHPVNYQPPIVKELGEILYTGIELVPDFTLTGIYD